MNPRTLSILSVLAVVAASAVLPVSAITAAITFSVVGILAILEADYGREIRPLRAEDSTVSFPSPGRSRAEMREAA
jgi:hypothetical protein